MKLDLNDLQPKEAELSLSKFPNEKFILRPFSLRAQIWVRQLLGEETYESRLKDIFSNQSLPEISQIAFFLVKNKQLVPTLDDFQDAILTQQDRVNLLTAMLETVGMSQPVLQKIADEEDALKKNAESLSPELTGAPTTTSSPSNTDTPSISS